jgi:hypothetical protein
MIIYSDTTITESHPHIFKFIITFAMSKNEMESSLLLARAAIFIYNMIINILVWYRIRKDAIITRTEQLMHDAIVTKQLSEV